MNITIFGSTGETGLLLIKKTLEAGYKVTAYARTPSKITINDGNLTIVKGELTDTEQIKKAITGSNVVISTLGPTGKSKGLDVANGIKNIVTEMENNNIKRFIAIATPSFKDKNDKYHFGFALTTWMVKILMNNSYMNMVEIGKAISNSNLDWTIVRIPFLTRKPAVGKVKVGYPGDGKVKVFALTKEDLANFLLQQINDIKYIKKSPAISN